MRAGGDKQVHKTLPIIHDDIKKFMKETKYKNMQCIIQLLYYLSENSQSYVKEYCDMDPEGLEVWKTKTMKEVSHQFVKMTSS